MPLIVGWLCYCKFIFCAVFTQVLLILISIIISFNLIILSLHAYCLMFILPFIYWPFFSKDQETL